MSVRNVAIALVGTVLWALGAAIAETGFERQPIEKDGRDPRGDASGHEARSTDRSSSSVTNV
ncbi:MAG: hypothetical protein AAF517_22755 [Planctomycetota bacterium]